LFYPNNLFITPRVFQEKRSPANNASLGFAKTYDLVDHQYLLELLSALGLSDQFLNLVKSLINEISAKVHFNGLFTDKFPLTKG
jgi:hypothetical protein